MAGRRLIPPVALLLLLAALGYFTDALIPWRVGSGRGPTWLGFALAVLGGAIALLGVREFRRARTTVDPLHLDRASAIVASGVFRHTRNPMYVGFALILLGWQVSLANPLAFRWWIAFVAYLDRVQIPAEERALRQRFGNALAEYIDRTPRWLCRSTADAKPLRLPGEGTGVATARRSPREPRDKERLQPKFTQACETFSLS